MKRNATAVWNGTVKEGKDPKHNTKPNPILFQQPF